MENEIKNEMEITTEMDNKIVNKTGYGQIKSKQKANLK